MCWLASDPAVPGAAKARPVAVVTLANTPELCRNISAIAGVVKSSDAQKTAPPLACHATLLAIASGSLR
jgi:hypothetical protein